MWLNGNKIFVYLEDADYFRDEWILDRLLHDPLTGGPGAPGNPGAPFLPGWPISPVGPAGPD